MRNFFPFGLALVVVFLGAMALSHIPKGVSASDDVSIGKVAGVSRYQVSGDRQGKVTVRDAVSGAIVRTFQMDFEVVRETFLLDNGRTVIASQTNHAFFWDLATGREIRRFPQRIYRFSPNESKFFVYNPREIFLYAYPSFRLVCSFFQGSSLEPKAFSFSPDERFVVITFAGGDPYYPHPEDLSIIYSKLFDLHLCQEIQVFSKLNVSGNIRFSSDSRFLYLENVELRLGERFTEGSWRLNLMTYEIEELSK